MAAASPGNGLESLGPVERMGTVGTGVHQFFSDTLIMRDYFNCTQSLCFKSNTVNEGLAAHFQNFVVVAYFPPKNSYVLKRPVRLIVIGVVLLLAYSFDIVVAFFVTCEQVKLYLLW